MNPKNLKPKHAKMKKVNKPSNWIRGRMARFVDFVSEAQSLLKFEVCPDDVKQETGDTVFCNTIIGLKV